MNRASIAVTLGLGALSLPCSLLAQTTDEIFKRAQERFAQDERDQASWSAEEREAAEKGLRDLKANRCLDGEDGVLCNVVVLCSRAPEIAGESLPDNKELKAANKALDDFDDDLKKLASALGRMKIASARFEKGARTARDRCEAKVRTAFRSEVGASSYQYTDPGEAAEASTPNPIYDGPVAIRPMVTAPQLMRKVPPIITKPSETPSEKP